MPIVSRSTRNRGRIDWHDVRDSIDLATVVARYLGPAPGRRGEGGRRLWWCCPFHPDKNPSFMVEPGKPSWRCWGCGETGDAATLVMKLDGVSFPDAVAILTGGRPDPRKGSAPRPAPRHADPPATKPEAPASRGMTPEAAAALVDKAARDLLTPFEGPRPIAKLTTAEELLAYLTDRGLSLETIQAARLGAAVNIAARTRDGRPYTASGILIPWYARGRVVKLNVRQLWERKPKYAEVYRDEIDPPRLYPSPETIRPVRPLVVVEGEFDALLLGQALGDRASVITAGSASVGPDDATLDRLIVAPAWYVAHDADPAGDKAAVAWLKYPRARRIRPPDPFKDWTDAARGGVDLAGWWSGILNPPLFTGEDLESWRWGPALGDRPEAPPEGDPDPAMDAYALAEREAIVADNNV